MTKEESKKRVALNEKRFQDAWDEGDDETLWLSVKEACKNIILSKCYKIRVPDVDDKVMDATMKVMERIKRDNVRPDKLSSFCYLYCIGVLYNKKTQKWERNIDIETILNNKKYICENELLEVYLTEE